MLTAKIFAKNVRQGAREFFDIKRMKEDWVYLPMNSLLSPVRVRPVVKLPVVLGGRSFTRFKYEQK